MLKNGKRRIGCAHAQGSRKIIENASMIIHVPNIYYTGAQPMRPQRSGRASSSASCRWDIVRLCIPKVTKSTTVARANCDVASVQRKDDLWHRWLSLIGWPLHRGLLRAARHRRWWWRRIGGRMLRCCPARRSSVGRCRAALKEGTVATTVVGSRRCGD